MPSILDRLLDDEPEVSREPLPNRFQNLSQLKKAVARDLEALLNTRQEILEEVPSEFTEVSRSLLTYGLPDFTSFSLLSMNDRNRIRRALEQAIATFEPRLRAGARDPGTPAGARPHFALSYRGAAAGGAGSRAGHIRCGFTAKHPRIYGSRPRLMPDDLLTYYERELTFLRQIGAEFAGKYPKIASRLLLEADKC